MHTCGEAQGDTMGLRAPHAVLLAVQSSVDEFRSQDFGLKLNWKHPWDQTWCILFCLQNGTLIRPASTRFVIGLQSRLFAESIVQVGVYGGGWIYGGWIWS
jgi:hypothetical protein